MVTYLLFCKIPNGERDTKNGYNLWEENNLYQFSRKTLNILSISDNRILCKPSCQSINLVLITLGQSR